MSGWTYAGGAQVPEEFLNVADGGHGPWDVDVTGQRTGAGLGAPVGSRIEYGVDSNTREFRIEVRDDSGNLLVEGPAEYKLGTMSGPNSSGAAFVVVASLARYTKAGSEDDWHLYGLSVVGDPNDAGVIGAQGGG